MPPTTARESTLETFPWRADLPTRLRALLPFATLAPSSHNAQPWRFVVADDHVDVHVELDRWLRVADADQRELYVSIGCALENLLIAADEVGLRTRVGYFPDPDATTLAARVQMEGAGGDHARGGPLFAAISRRRTVRERFRDEPPAPSQLGSLTSCGASDVHVVLSADPAVARRFDELTTRADALQFADPAWREELGEWIGRGVYGHGWLLSRMARLAVAHLNLGASSGRSDHALLSHTPVLGLIVTAGDTPLERVRAGQTFERVWLLAEAGGLALHPMNQTLQIPASREAVRTLIEGDLRAPQIAFRLGRPLATGDARSPRRPIDEVVDPPTTEPGPT